jgi:recombinational DNA repair ATPase RecF
VITQLSIEHFKAIASATIPLGPITVLVGPNDSGKSTILQALMALSRCGDPARFSAEQVLACAPSVVATRGDTSVNIEIVAEGMAAGFGRTAREAVPISLPGELLFIAKRDRNRGPPDG